MRKNFQFFPIWGSKTFFNFQFKNRHSECNEEALSINRHSGLSRILPIYRLRSFTDVQDDKRGFKTRWQRGVTLIELILYMGIFSSLLMVLVQLFGTIVNVNLEAQSTSAVAQDGRFILTRFAYDMRRTQSISSPSSLQLGVQNPVIQVLQFTTTDGTQYKYSLSGSNLMLTNLSVVPNTVDQINSAGTTVSGISFTRLATSGTSGTNTITMSFTLTSTVTRAGRGTEQKSFQTTVGTRN